MSPKLDVVLTLAERIGKVILIVVPCIRAVVSELEATQTKAALVSNEEE